jgi:hypothetical protein
MSTFLIFARPGAQIPDDESEIVDDRFSALAFAFPAIWLLFSRLWLEALIAFLLVAVSSLMMMTPDWFWPGLALGFAVSAVTGLEGRNWRANALARRGWRMADLIEADDADTAFDIHIHRALSLQADSGTERPEPRPVFSRPGRGHDSGAGTIGLVPVERN